MMATWSVTSPHSTTKATMLIKCRQTHDEDSVTDGEDVEFGDDSQRPMSGGGEFSGT
jgi:hypothetical protein